MSLLATITGAVGKDHVPVAWQCAGQSQVVGRLLGVLQRLQLVEAAIGPYVAAIHLIDGLIEDKAAGLLAVRQRQFLGHREQPAADAEAGGGGGAVVLHVQLVRNLVGLQLALEVVLDDLEQVEILLRVGGEVGALHQDLPHHLGVGGFLHRHGAHLVVGQHHLDVHRRGGYIVLGVREKVLNGIALGNHAHGAHLLQILLQAAATRVQLLFAELEGPLPGQLGEVEAGELLAQQRVQVGELPIPTRAQLPPGHVYIEDDIPLAIPIDDPIVGYASKGRENGQLEIIEAPRGDSPDGQRSLVRVVNVGVAALILLRLQAIGLLGEKGKKIENFNLWLRKMFPFAIYIPLIRVT